ncbi:MAG: ATP phosphoribosyltransferase [Candidatus Sericytochromatia bacterium]|nr:ATP phosphoribosyltransferase [Candidatus Tanganyikabacteria bacterium]
MPELVVALAKGRLMDRAVAVLGAAGIVFDGLDSRRLRVRGGAYEFLLVKPLDVPTYVAHGAADAGLCGSDVLAESGADVFEPLDLGISRCRLVVAGKRGTGTEGYLGGSVVRVATKYPRTTERFFHDRGVPVELVHLAGSVELAPLVGLADHIVDLVETGATLRDNGLEILETIAACSARLIVNRASFTTKRDAVSRLVATFRDAFAVVT